MGMGQCMCCVHRTLCLGLPHPSPSAHCACNLLWGWAAAPDLCALQDMCTCLLGLLIWVLACCVYQTDQKMTGFCPVCCHSELTGAAPCVWAAQSTAPSPHTFPRLSPMGRLLSSWPAHGGKRGKGKRGLGHCMFWLHRTLCLGLPHPKLLMVLVIFSGG